MQHVLDNPVWHALNGPHKRIALGRGQARRYPRDVAPFSAIAEPTDAAYADLAIDLPANMEARLFRPAEEPAPLRWETVSTKPIMQMTASTLTTEASDTEPTALGAKDVPDMLDLAALTTPGPFAARTPMLGHYEGYREHGRLLAMGGERLRLPGFVELSAICVHPAAHGRGLGAAITRHLARRVLESGAIPFLHVFPENPAIRLYQRRGFHERACLWVTWRRVAR
jgi:predicted GNAT family acetyltransferase